MRCNKSFEKARSIQTDASYRYPSQPYLMMRMPLPNGEGGREGTNFEKRLKIEYPMHSVYHTTVVIICQKNAVLLCNATCMSSSKPFLSGGYKYLNYLFLELKAIIHDHISEALDYVYIWIYPRPSQTRGTARQYNPTLTRGESLTPSLEIQISSFPTTKPPYWIPRPEQPKTRSCKICIIPQERDDAG